MVGVDFKELAAAYEQKDRDQARIRRTLTGRGLEVHLRRRGVTSSPVEASGHVEQPGERTQFWRLNPFTFFSIWAAFSSSFRTRTICFHVSARCCWNRSRGAGFWVSR